MFNRQTDRLKIISFSNKSSSWTASLDLASSLSQIKTWLEQVNRAGLWGELMYTFPNIFPIFCYWWEMQGGCVSLGVKSRCCVSPRSPVCSCLGVSDVMYRAWWSRALTHLGKCPVLIALWDEDGLLRLLGLLQSLVSLQEALWLAWFWNTYTAELRILHVWAKLHKYDVFITGIQLHSFICNNTINN